MRVKRYVVNTLPDALPMIRSELGKDAVILNTKEIRVGGFLGMFRKKKMEVIAAVETGAQPPRPQPSKSASAAQAQATVQAVAQQSAKARLAEAADAQAAAPSPRETAFARQLQQAQAAAFAAQQASAQLASAEQATAAAIAEPAAATARPAAAGQQTAAQPMAAAGRAAYGQQAAGPDPVLEEIKQMKEMVVRLAKQQGEPAVPEALAPLRERLVAQDVAPAWIERLLEAIGEDPAYAGQPDEATAWRRAEAILTGWLAPLAAPGIGKSDRIVHFVGPTGVGKTTTIAKLAAEQTLKHSRKAGFITSDTYRIAAVDQLRTYANILNVPLEVVFSPAELVRAFKQLEERDLIFMDTAGRNFRNELYVSEVNSLLQSDASSETYLVLSLTGKTRDMEVVAERFAKHGIRKVIFTKSDETDTYGAVVNIALTHGMQTAYIACGQNVPDDIEPFRADTFVKQLLGAEAHE